MRIREYIKPMFFVLCFIFVVMSFIYFDQPVAYFFQSLNVQENLHAIGWVTHVGTASLFLVLLVVLAVFFHFVYQHPSLKSRCCFLFCCLFIPNTMCLILKILLGRARPEMLFSDHVYGFYGVHLTEPLYWSFPSGHTTTIVALLFGMYCILPKYKFLWIVIAVLCASTRVLLNQHYLSDVLATACLTLLELFLMLNVMQRKGWFQSIAYQKAA